MSASDRLAFEYHYTSLVPPGLVPRFIVRTSSLSAGQPRWRTGVILRFEGNVAVVKADPLARVLSICVTGEASGRRRLLTVIRSNLESVHRSYGIQPQGMVPIQHCPGLLIRYDKLLVLERRKKKEFEEVYGDDVVSLDVSKLLDGIDLDGAIARSRHAEELPLAEAFISYSHKDDGVRAALENQLKILQYVGVLGAWSDQRIVPGSNWQDQIDSAVDRADIIILLVSADFLASTFCRDIEMNRAIKRASEGSALVVPVIIRDCLWRESPLARFQVLPRSGVPIGSLAPEAQDSAWAHVAQSLSSLAKQLHRRTKRASAR